MQLKTCWFCPLYTFYFWILMAQSDHSGRKDCGCIWSRVNIDLVRIFLLWFVIFFLHLVWGCCLLGSRETFRTGGTLQMEQTAG